MLEAITRLNSEMDRLHAEINAVQGLSPAFFSGIEGEGDGSQIKEERLAALQAAYDAASNAVNIIATLQNGGWLIV